MNRRRLRVLLIAFIGLPLLLLVCGLLYLKLSDLSGWRDTLATVVSDAIGRELKINGKFSADVGFSTRIVAGDVTLANPAWSNELYMVSVDHLAGEVDTLSFLFGPITIHDVEITGARVLFEVDAEGEFNWVFTSGEPPVSDGSGGDDDEFQMVISHALLEGVELVYSPAGGTGLQSVLHHLEFDDRGAGMLELGLEGSFEGTPLEISGRLGSFVGLINANAVEHDLRGRLADAAFSLRGTIDDLGALTGVDADISASGPELGRVLETFGLDPAIRGPFTAEATVNPSPSGSGVNLDATAGGISAHVDGVVDSLTRWSNLDATVTATGPSIRAVGALTGVEDLPDEEFSVSGGLHWEGFPISFKQVEIAIGENTLSADGVLGSPPLMMGTDFSISGQGPNIAAIGALGGVPLPQDRFSIEGRVVRIEGGLQVDSVEAHIGRTILRVDGKVGDPPGYSGTQLEIHANGPSLTGINNLLGMPLPAEPFAIDGRFVEKDGAIGLEGVRAEFGRSMLRIDGTLKTAQGLSGSTLQIAAHGPDATDLRALEVLEHLPAEGWSLVGGVSILRSGVRLDGVTAAIGSLEARGDGRLSTTEGLVGTDLQLHAEDGNLSHAMHIFGVDDFPHVPARVDGRLRVEAEGFRLNGATGTAGDIDVAIDGLIGGGSGLDGTLGHVSVKGPRLSSLGPYFSRSGLPAAPFSIVGDVQIVDGAYKLTGFTTEVDQTRAKVNGTVIFSQGLVGTDVHVEFSAPDLEKTGRLLAGLVTLPDLPAEEFTVATNLHIAETGYEIDGLRATVGRAATTVDGRIGPLPDFVGTDLTIEGDGPDTSLFKALTGVTIPVAPFTVSGRVQRTDSGYEFDRVAVRLAGHSVNLHGSLGERPRLIGTELDLHASGPGTSLIADLMGFDKLPDEPFSIGGHFDGTAEKFTTKDLRITLGESDLEGALEVDIRGKPQITASVSSKYLQLGRLAPPDADQATVPQTASGDSKAGLVFSEKPIDFGWLRHANADLDVTIGTLQLPVKRFHDFELEAHLVDGRLDINRIAMVGSDEGRGSGSLILEPTGDSYRGELDLVLSAIRFDSPVEDATDTTSAPPVDFNVRLKAQGKSPHEFAGSSDGSIQIVAGKGVMDNRALDLISADILLTLLNAFNPFAEDEEMTELECAVILLRFDQGKATLQPMALQSNKMTMLGKGRIDFATENLDLNWVTKPRKGIGISASMLTNPYIKLGGTLAKPAIELKPLHATASTGVAVATMGLSLIAKGMLDRVTSEKKVCKQALEEVKEIQTKQ